MDNKKYLHFHSGHVYAVTKQGCSSGEEQSPLTDLLVDAESGTVLDVWQDGDLVRLPPPEETHSIDLHGKLILPVRIYLLFSSNFFSKSFVKFYSTKTKENE